jgi:2-dehydropantoate 2-reductase
VARGEQLNALRDHGLELATPTWSDHLRVEVHAAIDEIAIEAGDILLLCVKSQHLEVALEALRRVAPPTLPLVCAQNGVAAERMASDHFRHVYGMLVFAPMTFLRAGEVALHSSPLSGALELGCHPHGSDPLAEELALDFQSAGFRGSVIPDVMRWKYGKLLGNLESAVQALVGRDALGSDLVARLRDEAVGVLRQVGIDHATFDEMSGRYAFVNDLPVRGRRRQGGSSWQSLARDTGNIETDYLNGEIVRIAERNGLSAPLNRALTRLALRAAHERWLPGAMTLAELVARLSAQPE